MHEWLANHFCPAEPSQSQSWMLVSSGKSLGLPAALATNSSRLMTESDFEAMFFLATYWGEGLSESGDENGMIAHAQIVPILLQQPHQEDG